MFSISPENSTLGKNNVVGEKQHQHQAGSGHLSQSPSHIGDRNIWPLMLFPDRYWACGALAEKRRLWLLLQMRTQEKCLGTDPGAGTCFPQASRCGPSPDLSPLSASVSSSVHQEAQQPLPHGGGWGMRRRQ